MKSQCKTIKKTQITQKPINYAIYSYIMVNLITYLLFSFDFASTFLFPIYYTECIQYINSLITL